MFIFLFTNRSARHFIHDIVLFYMHLQQFDETVEEDVLITTRRFRKILQFKRKSRWDGING